MGERDEKTTPSPPPPPPPPPIAGDGAGATPSPPPPAQALTPPLEPATEPIEPATEPGDDDEFDGYETGSDAGSTSASSSIYAHTYELGRRYHSFRNGRYPIPNDDLEQNREDMKHTMLLELTDGVLFYAPIGPSPQMILDIGTGTGIWAIEVGDRFPSARVRGVDLSPIQPIWVPTNVDFLVDDCEKEWLQNDVDLAHFRFMAPILKDPARVIQNAYDALKPGGWIEFQELNGEPMCDDGTMSPDDPVARIYNLAHESFQHFGMDTTMASKLEPLLAGAGFEDIQCKVKKVPIGVWAKDKTLRLVGLYQKMAVIDLIPAFAGRAFPALGMSQIESQVLLALARKGLEDVDVHRYFCYYFWYAQKPLDGGKATAASP